MLFRSRRTGTDFNTSVESARSETIPMTAPFPRHDLPPPRRISWLAAIATAAACAADPALAAELLGWRAARTIDDMCADAWRWQAANPDGYGAA